MSLRPALVHGVTREQGPGSTHPAGRAIVQLGLCLWLGDGEGADGSRRGGEIRGLRKPRGKHPGLEQLKREDQSPGAAAGEIGLVLGRSEAWSDGREDQTGKERGDQKPH